MIFTLAYTIKSPADAGIFSLPVIEKLADFCASQNPSFMRDRWMDYIACKCGRNGGAVK